ncbi:MAG: hypothetical protein P8Y64_13855 [Gammaproteobacteria bacterium]
MSRRLISIIGLPLILLITGLIYWPGIGGGFVMDDYSNIVNNKALVLPNLGLYSLLSAAYSLNTNVLGRPLSMLSFALNIHAAGGLLPAPMKLTNILIHLANGVLVYALLSQLLRAWQRRTGNAPSTSMLGLTALLITAAWLLAPINLTSVLYVVQRMTSLSATFVLLGCIIYLWARLRMLDNRLGLPWLIPGVILCGGIGVLFKESAALLPLYTLIIEWTLFDFCRADGRRDRRLMVLYLFILVLPGVAGLVWLAPSLIHGFDNRSFTLGERLITEPRVVLDYVRWILVPTPNVLSLYHDDYPISHGLLTPPTTIFAIGGILMLLGLALWQRARRPLLSLGILWFLGGQLLTATVFNLELVYEHRNYLPSLGLLLALFTLLLFEPRLRDRRLLTTGLSLALLLLYGTVTAMRVHEWANPVRYAVISATEHPQSPRATYALGRLYSVLAITHPKETQFHTLAASALRKAMQVPGSSILPESGLLILNARLDYTSDESLWKRMRTKLTAAPSADDTAALSSLVNCQREGDCRFPPRQMLKTLGTAIEKHPRQANLYNLYAIYENEVLGRPEIALSYMNKALELAPGNGNLWFNRFTIDLALRDYKAAEKDIQTLATLDRKGNYHNILLKMHSQLRQIRPPGAADRSSPHTEQSP